MIYVWKYFIDLHNNRTSSGFGINPIQFSDMKAYFDLMMIHPEEWEIDVIRILDNIALNQYSEEAKKNQAKSKPKSKK